MFFAKKTTKAQSQDNKVTTSLSHEDPKVQAYYNQLTQKQVVAHTIAVTHLGTSYDVMRTHGFVNWAKNMPK